MDELAFDGFDTRMVESGQGKVIVRIAGSGAPVLLLHGFPQTGLMWRDVAPGLAADFTVIIADLPGYGASDCPAASGDETMSKRALARTLVGAMRALGHERFAIVGHDRGGRVAYRAALDHPKTVTRVAVFDVVPTVEVWDRADARLALAFWPFSLLAQPYPLPESLIAAAPEAVIDNACDQWGSPPEIFPAWVRQAYAAQLRDPARVRAICDEYRAAAGVDRDHDRADRDAGHRIGCPLLAVWSAEGAVGTWYEDAGGPLAIWRDWTLQASGHGVAGGHFFPEEYPEATATLIADFLKSGGSDG